MKEIKFNGNYLTLYDSIRELPIHRFSEYNRYLMLDAGIGSNVEDVTNKIGKIQRFRAVKDEESVNKELQNLYQSFIFTIENTTPKMYAFFALVKDINGKPFDDLSKEKLDETIVKIGKQGLTFEKLNGTLLHVKKKCKRSLNYFFRKSAARQ